MNGCKKLGNREQCGGGCREFYGSGTVKYFDGVGGYTKLHMRLNFTEFNYTHTYIHTHKCIPKPNFKPIIQKAQKF